MSEAIGGKANALEKLGIYLESVAAAMDPPDLARILGAPLADFADRAALLRLRTGVAAFPWAAAVLERCADLDLGDFDAGPVSGQAREHVAGALGGNPNVRSVRIKGVRLDLSGGWATAELDWARKGGAVGAAPETVSLLLSCCTCLSSLDLR